MAVISLLPQAAQASAPGRLCLAGESLDWMVGGSSIVASIPLRTHASIWRVPGVDTVTLNSAAPINQTLVVDPRAISDYTGHPLDYVKAAARSANIDQTKISGTIIEVSTELPIAAGLSSSAAVTLAVVAALRTAYGMSSEVADICRRARQAEVSELQTGAGWMDFLACAQGGVNRVFATAQPEIVPMTPSLDIPIVLIDTRARRTTKAVLTSKRERFLAGDREIHSYIDATIGIVDKLASSLQEGVINYSKVGGLLTEAHRQLRDRVHCSTELIDECLKRLIAAGGYGGKLSGSGHGGCLFGLAPADALERVLMAVGELPVHTMVVPGTEQDGLRYFYSDVPGTAHRSTSELPITPGRSLRARPL